jgi:hypothetical protein
MAKRRTTKKTKKKKTKTAREKLGAKRNLDLNFINSSNDANNSSIVIFGDGDSLPKSPKRGSKKKSKSQPGRGAR